MRVNASNDFFKFANLLFFSGTLAQVTHLVNSWINNDKRARISVTGVHGVSESFVNSQFRGVLQQSTIIVPDGMPLVWVGKLLGYKKTTRIYGPDLFLALCDLAHRKSYKVYLFGTTDNTLFKLKKTLRLRYPDLKIFSRAPTLNPLSLLELKTAARSINASRPNIVFVGLSTPKQEVWMHSVIKIINPCVMVGVGAAFDFVSGTKAQAPTWIRGTGLEWVFRLLHEPRRLLGRYVRSGAIFAFLLLGYFFRSIIRHRK